MKNTFARLLLLSCLSVALPAYAQESTASSATSASTAAAADVMKAEMDKASASAVASMSAPAAGGIPQSAMGTTPGQGGVPLLPGQKPEPVVKMTYDKSKMEGPFYGAQMPKRLFNNVPSEWTTKAK